MVRYFLEVAYKGTHFSGFQIQQNANTVQAEIQKAFTVIYRRPLVLTGSSRTDAGVHALQNFFHFDDEKEIEGQFIYKMNAVLPADIVIKGFCQMPLTAHARFDAVSREYEYRIYGTKSPFLKGFAFYYPFALDRCMMQKAADFILEQKTFSAFCKANTQVANFNCSVLKSFWVVDGQLLVYNIEANRFLRGMVRMLTATMLQTGRGKLSISDWGSYFSEKAKKTTYSVPPEGLYLKRVNYPAGYFNKQA